MSRMVVRDETMSTGKVASTIRIPPSTLKDEDRDQEHFPFLIEIIIIQMINEIKLAIPLQFSILVCLNYKCTSDTRTGDIVQLSPSPWR